VSHYIRILNNVKSAIAELPLTPSQDACNARIMERLAYPGTVNLYGGQGTGKTVLGWAMVARGQAAYVTHLSRIEGSLPTNDEIVVLDNAQADKAALRRSLVSLESAGIERVVIVTRLPADDYVFRAELRLTSDDTRMVAENLRKLGHSVPDGSWGSLWHMVMHAAREVE
jgi:hypothetical protein